MGREAELRALHAWFARPRARPALVWGRRRVGKTTLIQRFADDLDRVVFHSGVGEPEAAELAILSRAVRAVFPAELRDLSVTPYRDWHDALDHLARVAQDQPVLLVLDEFPELIKGSRTLPGVLRAFLDRARERTQLRILLCGSAVRTMWSIQQERAPLYGRFDLVMQVHPFRPSEAAQMLPALAPVDRALAYGVVGGMPLYLSWWRPECTVEDNLLELAGRPGSPLLTEGRLVMLTEVGGGEPSAATLYALAAGKTRHSEIADVIGSDPTRILDRLIEARLVQRMIPITENPHRSRRKMYRIADNFLAFYLGTLLRYRTEIERGHGSTIVPALVRKLDDHMGAAFEEAFRDHLWSLAERDELGENVVAIGPWWQGDGQHQIDAVVLAEPDKSRVPVLVGEAKWTKQADGSRILRQLAVKTAALTPHPEQVRYAICARNSVSGAGSDVLTITAHDIFAG